MIRIDSLLRPSNTILLISHDEVGIGSIVLNEDTQDLYPVLKDAIDTYNRSREAQGKPQTITTGDEQTS